MFDKIKAVGDRVVARIRYVGVGRVTGIQVETPEFGAACEFREGHIVRVLQFSSYAEALEAAGLSQ